MKATKMFTILVLGLVVCLPRVSEAEPMETAFTYQGQLMDTNAPADGTYDFQFKLFNDNVAGIQQGSTVNVSDLDVTDGYFMAELDFGSDVFNSDARWLEVGVRPGDSSAGFTTLSPRQKVTAVPYALQTRGIFVDGSLNVGIGTTNPIGKLHVDGGMAAAGTNGTDIVIEAQQGGVGNPDGYDGGNIILLPGEGGFGSMGGTRGDKGNVGIGTTNPTEKLTVAGKVESTNGGYKFPDGSTQTTAYMGSGSDVKQLVQDFVVAAGESITAGDVVSFLDGYVQKGFVPGDRISHGLEQVFNSGAKLFFRAVALTANKFVIVFPDEYDSDKGTGMIGEISGNIITYGSKYIFNAGGGTSDISVAALSSNKFVVCYEDWGNSGAATCVVGEVSGTTITYTLEYVFNTPSADKISVTALASDKFVVAYIDENNNDYGTCRIGEVTGHNNPAFGGKYVFETSTILEISVAAFSVDKFVIAYEARPAGYYNACVIGEVSGTNITYGPKYMFSQDFTSYISPVVLSIDKFVLVYVDGDNFNYGTCIVGDVSGTTITYGSECVLGHYSTSTIYSSALTENRFVVTYLGTNFGGTSIIGEISGNTITYGPKCVFNSKYPLLAVRFVANLCPTEFLVGYFYTEDDGVTVNNTVIIGTATSGWLTGIAKESKTTGQTVPVIIGGVSDVHSGLTSGDVYYATSLGDLTTGSTNYKVGLAISSSEILLGSNRENRDQFFGDMVFANNFRITEGSAFEGLVLQNQFGREILFVDEEGILNINGLSFNNTATKKPRWMMFEDKQGLHLEDVKAGKVYSFVLQEAENENNLNGLSNLEKAMKDLQTENNALKQRLEAVEKTIQKNRLSSAR